MALSRSRSITSTPLQDAIQSVYTILVKKLCAKDIREDLFAQEIINMPLKQTIQNKSNSKDANEALVDHLYNSGTIGLVERFIQVLRDTSSSYEVHEEIARTLEGALRVHNATVQSLPGQSKSLLISFGKMVREKNAQLRVVPPDMTTEELMFVELAVLKSSVHVKRQKDVTNFILAALEGIDKFYEQSESIRYEDVLSPGKHKFYRQSNCQHGPSSVKYKFGKRMVINGAPGCGKSTLSRKYCKDLSSGVLSNDYQLVILCHLREVSHHLKEYEELTLNHFLAKYSCDDPSIAVTLQRSKGKGLILILDGYDEISEQMKKSKFMNELLSPDSRYLNECDLIVTTRPFICPEVYSEMGHRCLHVEILGFTEEKINLFIDNYFSKSRVPNKKMSDQLKERLQSLPTLQGMCRLPVVLKIICKVQEYLEDKGLPCTMGGIYRLYIKRQLLHASKDLKISDILKIPDHLLPWFSPLCKVSYDFSLTQKLVLSEEDLGVDLVKHVKRGSIYELLFAELADDFDAASPVQLYMFLHKTIQEALAAVHVAKQTKPEQERIWREQFGRPEMAEVWKFYCNFTQLENIDFLSLLQASNDQSGNRNVLLMLSFFEADNEDLSKRYLPQVISDELTFRINSAYETVVLQYTLQHHDGIRVLKIASSKIVNIHFHLVLPTILSLQSLTELEISEIELNDSKSFDDLWEGNTDVVPSSSSLKCSLYLTLTVHEWVDVFLCIAQSERLEQIKVYPMIREGTNQVDPALCDNVTSSLKRMHSLKRFAVFSKSLKYNLTKSLLLGPLCNTSTTEVYISDRTNGYERFDNLWKGVVPSSSSLKCTLDLTLTVHEWVDVFLCITQSERLEQIKVYTRISEGTSEVDPALSKKLTFSLKEMHSLKRFNVFTRSLKYPLVRSLLLGALCNTSTTEVYISDRVVGFYNLWEGSTHVVPISSSVKCTLHQRLAVHEWLDVFLCIVQSERLEQIKMDGVISEDHLSDYHSVDFEKLTQLREAFKHNNLKKVDIKLFSSSRTPDEGRTTLALMSTLLEGVAIYIQNIEFTYYSDDPGSIKELQTQISPSLRQMFEWSSNKCVLKPLEMGPSLNPSPSRPLSKPNLRQGAVKPKQDPTIRHQSLLPQRPHTQQSKFRRSQIRPGSSVPARINRDHTPKFASFQGYTPMATPPQRLHPMATPPQSLHTVATHPRRLHPMATPPRSPHTMATPPQRPHTVATHPRRLHPMATPPRSPHTMATPPQRPHPMATPPQRPHPMVTPPPRPHPMVTPPPRPHLKKTASSKLYPLGYSHPKPHPHQFQ